MGILSRLFSTVDRQTVIGILRDAGTRDPDVLHSRKSQLIAEAKSARLAGTAVMLFGAFLSVTVVLAPVGIPIVLLGWWIRHRASGSIATVERGFAEFIGSPR